MEHKNLPHDHGYHNEEEIMKNMPGEDEIAGVSEAMKQLGDPSRLRIFWLLCTAKNVFSISPRLLT